MCFKYAGVTLIQLYIQCSRHSSWI